MTKGRKVKPSDHLLLGLGVITLEVVVTWWYYIKNVLRQKKADPEAKVSVPISDQAFEEELDRASASNGNGTVETEQEVPCPCEDPEPPSPTLSETEEEPESPVSSLPENDPESPSLAEAETPETDTH